MLNLAVWNVRGLNKRDHQLALKDLISEYRIDFMGILETRVRINNVMHIQSFLLPHWKWFVDYATVGNRIWVAWDDNVVDVHILDLGNQFMHCRVTHRADSESLIITIVYGASEMIDRRSIWNTLEILAGEHSDEPWLVGGDFNAVREMNEVCGASGDIRMAMEEFNVGIQEAGLIPLPMQGEWYTWHNCSTNSRSLWKRLDRILINDRWLARPWARHILSNEEAGHLILAFTPDDVKQAVIISPCQGAFIPGRSIGDNILLAQELLTGYNQVRLPPRCTLKVDIRKAYDTVEWDFLLAVLQLFGFPQTFTRWIEECVTTVAFSIGLNGNPYGFFAGARGLRQGDPLSPYLFVLVMEVLHLGLLQLIEQDLQFSYHWKCEPAKLFQLGFADDLLLFCRADLNSLRTLKRGLDRFAEWSGLRLNVQKSHVIISRSAQAMSIYWASAFILPKAIIKQIEKRLRTFLWKGTSTSGYAKVAWKDVCKPIKEGGQGIKDIGILNRSLIAKKLCDVIRCDRTSVWVEWLKQTRLHNTSIWTINEKGGSWGWRKLLRLRSSILPMTVFLIGEGRSFYLWKDPWHHLGPLIARFPRGPSLLGLDESAKLQVVINEGQWQWPFITDLECMEIIYMLPQIHGGDDRINWRFSEGRPTKQSLYRLFCPSGPKVGCLHYFRVL
ncbi:UNVERIFIED_CONTAM: hypothetical protein Sindi_2651300 [Sesamum indicum]